MVTTRHEQGPRFYWRPVLALCAAVGLLGGCEGGWEVPPSPPPIDSPAPASSGPREPTYVSCRDTQIDVSWHLVQDGLDVQCLPGDTVSVRVDSDRMIADFPCSDGGGLTPPVEGGVVHNLSYVLSDEDGNVLSQTGDLALGVVCGGATLAPEVELPL